jgi:subtilisin family serine protease
MSTIEELRRDPRVRYAEPDYVYHVADLPDDPSFGQLWGLDNTGQPVNGTSGTPDADIDAPDAWSITTGSASVIVGVVDTGLDYNHPDLAPNVWSNPGGIGGCPAGTHGYNAIAHTCDPMDDNNHGSHTSGTIGAAGNNGLGVAGVNWDVSLIGLKAFNASGSTTSTSIVEALQWALDAKAAGVNIRVLNNSWGGWQSSQATLDLINALAAQDVLFVAAAGNYGIPNTLLPFYPCDYPVATIICVGASTQSDQLASFSNYGTSSVDLAAPGTNVYSTLRAGAYGYANGTSMATPHVTGAAALLLSRGSLSAADVKTAILDGVDVLPSLSGKVGTSGRLNLVGMLGDAAPPGLPGAPTLAGAAGDASVDLGWTTPDEGASSIVGYRLYRGIASGGETLLTELGPVATFHDPDVVNGTTYYYQVSAVNDQGEGPRSNEVALRPTAPPTAPAAPAVEGIAGDGRATLCWTPPYDGNATISGYRVYRTIAGDEQITDIGAVTSYIDAGLANGSTYVYEVSAVNAVGEGARSTPVALTPPGSPPAIVGFTPAIAVGGTPITISGTDLAGCGTTVAFGVREGSVTSASPTELVATSPPAGGSGKVRVSTAAGEAISVADFFAVPAGSTAAEVAVADRMTLGGVKAVSLPTAGTLGLILFEGTAGGRVSLRVTSTISQTDVSIKNPDGTNLANPTLVTTSGGFIDTRTLAQTGTYTIVLNPRSSYTGTLTLTLYDVPPDASGTIEAGGAAVPVAIGTPGQNGALTFEGTAGQSYTLVISAVTVTQTDVSIKNPDGTNRVNPTLVTTSGKTITFTAGASGTYTIVVNPRTYYTGSLTFRL